MEEKTAQKLVKTMERLCRAVERLAEEPVELTEAEFEEGLRTGRFKTKPDYGEPECDFCKDVKKHSIPASLATATFGVSRTYPIVMNYCPECGRKL